MKHRSKLEKLRRFERMAPRYEEPRGRYPYTVLVDGIPIYCATPSEAIALAKGVEVYRPLSNLEIQLEKLRSMPKRKSRAEIAEEKEDEMYRALGEEIEHHPIGGHLRRR